MSRSGANIGSGIDARQAEQAWREFCDALQSAGVVVYGDPRVDSDRLRAEGLRYLLRVLSATTTVGLELADPAYPRLFRLYDTYRNLANCNPDCIYLYARVSPEFSYRISGRRGSAKMFEIATMDDAMLDYPRGKWVRTVSEFEVDLDGNIEINLSAAPQTKNWVQLDSPVRWLYLRQYFYDWDKEEPAQLTIERVGATYPAPPPDPQKLLDEFRNLTRVTPDWIRSLGRDLVGKFYAGPPDRLLFSGATGGFAGISYGRGYFKIAEDEAVILELSPPDAFYWSIHLGSHYWEGLDWDMRQSSLNGHQAQIDPDGRFRGVIALSDPGVPNWLDPAGHTLGLLCCRVLRGDRVPEVTLRTVPLADLRRHLHPQTPSVSSEQRAAVIRQRMLGVQRRNRE